MKRVNRVTNRAKLISVCLGVLIFTLSASPNQLEANATQESLPDLVISGASIGSDCRLTFSMINVSSTDGISPVGPVPHFDFEYGYVDDGGGYPVILSGASQSPFFGKTARVFTSSIQNYVGTQINVNIDSGNLIAESDETNNGATINVPASCQSPLDPNFVSVYPDGYLPDLIVAKASWQGCDLVLDIQNIGPGDALRPFVVQAGRFKLTSNPNSFGAKRVTITNLYGNGFGWGTGNYALNPKPVIENAKVSIFKPYVTVTVDENNRIAELDENNNTLTVKAPFKCRGFWWGRMAEDFGRAIPNAIEFGRRGQFGAALEFLRAAEANTLQARDEFFSEEFDAEMTGTCRELFGAFGANLESLPETMSTLVSETGRAFELQSQEVFDAALDDFLPTKEIVDGRIRSLDRSGC